MRKFLVSLFTVGPLVANGLGATAAADTISQQYIIHVSATIPAHVYLIVSRTSQLTEIYSNCRTAAPPLAIQGSRNGKPTELTAGLLSQYEALKPTLSFAHSGVLYQAPALPVNPLTQLTANTASSSGLAGAPVARPSITQAKVNVSKISAVL